MKCAICGEEIKGYGNSGFPAINGVVCDYCNGAVTVPLRVFTSSLYGKKNVAIVVKPDHIELRCPKDTYFTIEELQESVEGYFTFAKPVTDDCFTVVNEEGKLKGLRPNPLAQKVFGLDIVGNALIVPKGIFEKPSK